MGSQMLMLENDNLKLVKSKTYNSFFNKETGFFARWGVNKEQDPLYAPMPEILDLEISAGKCMGQCPECYKCNGAVEETHNMTFEQFKNIFHKVAKTKVEVRTLDGESKIAEYNSSFGCFKTATTKKEIENYVIDLYNKKLNLDVKSVKVYNSGLLQQIAFGICDIGTNPDFFNMLEYCREFDVIPNYTCHALDMNEEYAKLSAKYCGAVAVSVYNKEKSYNAVNMLFNAGVKQINFHVIAHDKSYKRILSIIDDLKTDERIKGKVKAVVLLKYKPKGNGVGKFNHLTDEQYREIISYAENNGVSIGFDSCSAHAYLRTIKNDPDFDKKSLCVEPCESSCFSSYINHKGKFYACSFCEGEGMWKNGINVLNCDDFEQDVWNGEQTKTFRKILLDNKRKCPMYKLD